MGEEETARRVLELSRQGAGAERHVGWFLFRRPLGAEKRTRSGACYGPLVLLSAALLSAALALLLDSWVGGLLLFFPLSDLVKNSADFLLVRLCPRARSTAWRWSPASRRRGGPSASSRPC